MYDFKENEKLTREEIIKLRRQGYNLYEDGFYVIKFLFNDKWNNATDPRPFRIKPDLIKKLADDAVGMPYVVNPNSKIWHLRGTDEGKKDTAQNLLDIQARYAVGEIAAPIITESNNVYGIISIWPDYRRAVENNEIPAFTSPTIFPLREDSDGIDDAQFLNVNAVSVPGYPEILAGVTGVCKGGIKKCMEELAPLAASGSLESSRQDPKLFSILQRKIGITMPEDPNNQQKKPLTLEGVATEVEGLKGKVGAIETSVTSMNTKMDAIVKATGADKQKSADGKPIGAAGETLTIPEDLKDNPYVTQLLKHTSKTEKELKTMREEMEAKKIKDASDARLAQATSIVTNLIKLNRVKAEDKAKEIKKYVDLKNEDGTVKDLEVLDNFLKSEIAEPQENEDSEEPPLGAAGFDIAGDRENGQTVTISNTDALEMTH